VARGAGLRLVLQRARANPAPVASVAINVLVVCTLVSGLAASLGLLQRDALRSALTLAPAEETVLVASSPYDADDPGAQDRAFRDALTPLVEVAGGDVVSLAESGSYDLPGGTDDPVAFAAVTGADAWVGVVDGALPSSGGERLEVAAPAGGDLAVGDDAVLVARTDGRRVPVTVVGTWTPEPGGERWLGTLDPGSLLLAPDDFPEVGVTGSAARWRAVPDLDAVRPDQLATLSGTVGTTLAEVDAVAQSLSTSAQGDSGLVAVLDARARELTVLRALLLVPAGLLVLVAAAGLVLVAVGLAGVRHEEEALLRSRGAGYRQLAGPTVAETLLLCGGAALLAPLVAHLVVRIGDVRPPLDLAAWVGSSIAAAACALALSVPVVVRAVTGDRGEQLGVETRRRRSLTLLVTALLVAGGLAVLAVVTLQGFGDTVGAASVATDGVEPLLVASPALLLLGLAAVVSVLALPPLFGLVARAVAGRGVPLAIGTRFASRAPGAAVPVALATTLAVGTLAFAAVERASSAGARVDRAAYVAGADVRVTAPPPALRAGAAEEEQRLRALPGVADVHGVRRASVYVDDLRAEVLVTDLDDRPDLVGDADLPAVDEADDGVLPVVVSDRLAEGAALEVGDTLGLTVLGIPAQVRIAGTVPAVRTVPDGSGAVIADEAAVLPVLGEEGYAEEPTEWWLDLTPGTDPADVAAAVTDQPGLAAEVVTRASVLQRLDDDPSTGGAALGQVLLLTGSGTLVVGGLLLLSVVLLRRRERATQAWMLGSAGADRRDLLGVLGWEYGLVTGAGVVVGLLAGTVVAAVTLVSMTLGPDGQLLVPAPRLVLPWPLLIGAPAVMAVVPLLGLLWLTRRDHGRALTADAPVGGHR
jgi:hypothetical protein